MRRDGQLVLVAGGAGFIGSHICDVLIEAGAYVTCLDNFLTGRRDNIRQLEDNHRFSLIDHDVVEPLPRWAIVEQPLPADDPRRRRPDIGRAMDWLGWTPTIAFDTGLKATIAWFEQQGLRPVRTLLAAE